jgi:hypothetical protein
MRNRFWHIILLFILCLPDLSGQDSSVVLSLNTFEVIGLVNPWLSTGNPAGMAFNPRLFPGEVKAGYDGQWGGYKKAQQGGRLNSYSFGARSYTAAGNSVFFGSFRYNKSFEKGTHYTDVNDPYRGTPYLLIDTIGGDIYDREFFAIKGVMTTPLGGRVFLGLSSSLDVGLASQNRDPRPMNKVLDLNLSPGLVIKLPVVDVGINLLYDYYNEDIEIEIIEKNKEYDFFMMHGLATRTSHEAKSFYRLYKNNRAGASVQFDLKLGTVKSLFGARLQYGLETADDGRKAGDATWSSIKNDSRLKINMLDVFNITTIGKGPYIHSLKANLSMTGMLGTEIIQRLETPETGVSNWVTYAKEEKYDASETKVSFSYRMMKMKSPFLKNYELAAGVDYYDYTQDYYLPDRKEAYSNLLLSLEFGKSFYAGRHLLTLSCDLLYKENLSSTLDFMEDSFFFKELVSPDHRYNTSNYFAPALGVAWEIPVKKIFSKYFFNTHYQLYLADSDDTRSYFSFGTGLIF